jgi:hypothetical protein
MNRKTLMILILTMVTLALTLPLASASDWTQFHCDVAHTGYSTSNAPDTNHTAWISEDIGADFPSSVTVADGQIFVYCGDHLISLDEYTGAVFWNVPVNATPKVCGSWVTPAYHGGRVFLSANETCCFDAVDGSLGRQPLLRSGRSGRHRDLEFHGGRECSIDSRGIGCGRSGILW